MSKLTDWIEPSRKQHQQYEGIAASPAAQKTMSANVKGFGTTSPVHIACGAHLAGWSIRLVPESGSIKVKFAHDDDVDPGSMGGKFLAAFPHGSSIEWTCATCGKRGRATLLRVLEATLSALDTPKMRRNCAFVKL